MIKRLTIRILIATISFVLGVGLSRLIIRQDVTPVSTVNTADETSLIFEGTVLKIGPPVPGSGGFAFYRLAKYRVERVHYGHYEGNEIVVDHLSLTTHELDGLNEGNRVCVQATRSKKISLRTDVSGIREQSKKVETFYIAGEVNPAVNFDSSRRK
jgi:hypothetical protein